MRQIQMGGRCGNTCNIYCSLQFFMGEAGRETGGGARIPGLPSHLVTVGRVHSWARR